MELYKTIIVDDEKNSASALSMLVEKYCKQLQVIKIFNDPRKALDFLFSEEIDLVFLDIQMPHINGIDLLKKIPNPEFQVIYTTAYDQYAIDAIKLSALDYLLKPIDPENLVLAVDKFQSLGKKESDNEPKIKTDLKKLAVQLHDKTLFINYEDIVYLEAESNYTHIHQTNGSTQMTSKTIKFYQEQLAANGFYRVHQSYLVSVDKIAEYLKADHSIMLNSGKIIPVSKNRKDGLMNILFNGK